MYNRISSFKIVPLIILLLLLTACAQQETAEEHNFSLNVESIKESSVNIEEEENSPDAQPDVNADISNQDILAASAGTTVTQTIENSTGGVISIDAQVDVEGVSRVSRYRYIPLEFTEESRKALLEEAFPAETWDVIEAAVYDEQEDAWKFETPRGGSWVYRIDTSRILGEHVLDLKKTNVEIDYAEVEDGTTPLQPFNVENMLLFDGTPMEIEQIGLGWIVSVVKDAEYSCDCILVGGKGSGDLYAKAVFKQTLNGMPVTSWYDLCTVTSSDDPFPVRMWGSTYSVSEIGLAEAILTPQKAVEAMQEQIDSVQMQETQIGITKISLEYLTVISSEGAPEVVPVWRFWLGSDETERSMMCEQILAVDAVSGELIWEDRKAFAE